MTALLATENLTKTFGGLTVTDNVSLSLSAGERVALIGPNGAGKTTLVNLITGIARPDAGRVFLAGMDITRRSTAARARLGLARSFQVTRLFPDLTPEEHIALAILQREGRALRPFGHFDTSPALTAESARILATLGLTAIAHEKAGAIAYGQQRLLEIALVLALRPKVLLLDEPAAGIPQAELPRIEAALAQLPADLAVLVIEHDLDFVFRLARRVIVLAAGAVIFDGTPAMVKTDPHVRSAYLGSYADAGGLA